MRKLIIASLTLVILVVTGCHKTSVPKAGDEVEQKLQDLAGSAAKNCGRVATGGDVKTATDCAVQENQAKHPFYVAYDMPGLTAAVAGAADGKLYAVQSASGEGNTAATKQMTVTPCPGELRVAQSGRVTCYPVGSFGAGAAGSNPHGGGMTMPPGGNAGQHSGGMMMPPPGTPNPHGAVPMPAPGTPSHGGGGPD